MLYDDICMYKNSNRKCPFGKFWSRVLKQVHTILPTILLNLILPLNWCQGTIICNNKQGSVSIDLNGDFNNELIISHAFSPSGWTPDTFCLQHYQGYSYRTIRLNDQNLGIVTNDTIPYSFPFAIDSGVILNNSLDWSHEGLHYLVFAAVNYSNYNGYWYGQSEVKYLGLRYINHSDTIFGWLGVDPFNNLGNLEIRNVAFEQPF